MKKILGLLFVLVIGISGVNSPSAMALDALGGMEIHGFVSQGFMISDDNNFYADTEDDGTFQFNEIGINFAKELTDKLRIGVQLFSHDLGDIGNNEIMLDWAFADYHWRDWLGFRVGRIKSPMGFYNDTRDTDMLRTFVFLPQSVYNEPLRDTTVGLNGAGLYGNVDLNRMGEISYQLQAGGSNIDEAGGFAKIMPLERVDDVDVNHAYAASLEWALPVDGLRIGASWIEAETDVQGNLDSRLPTVGGTTALLNVKARLVTFSMEYTLENLILAAEYQTIRNDAEIDTVAGFEDTPAVDTEGYYVSATYRVTDWLELGTYYSIFYGDRDDKDGLRFETPAAQFLGNQDHQAWSKDFALTTRFDINEYWTFKLEGHLIDGTALLLDSDQEDYGITGDQHWGLFAAKMTFSF